eukprot:TRINITY_DN67987_c2_g2_i1.p1 TRINITY_DN67987_c2_g2~~TRINITY_DN67987_c2_g2_i1.p1  ORF type:complete len:682 (+),score=49.11 TRINITY_DN67987_c2_g2_i1:41-2047(+)
MESKCSVLDELSSPVMLGSLYDCRTQTVKSHELYPRPAVAENINFQGISQMKFQLWDKEDSSKVLKDLAVEAEMSAKIAGGLIKISGSGSFLQNLEEKEDCVSITVMHKYTSAVVGFSLTGLSPAVTHAEATKCGATHAVTSITYGGFGALEFSQKVHDKAERQKIRGNLDVAIKAIPGLDLSGNAQLHKDDKAQEHHKEISISMQGIWKPPPGKTLPKDYDGVKDVLLNICDWFPKPEADTIVGLLSEKNRNRLVGTITHFTITPLHVIWNGWDTIYHTIREDTLQSLAQMLHQLCGTVAQAKYRASRVRHMFPSLVGKLLERVKVLEAKKTEIANKLSPLLRTAKETGCMDPLVALLTECNNDQELNKLQIELNQLWSRSNATVEALLATPTIGPWDSHPPTGKFLLASVQLQHKHAAGFVDDLLHLAGIQTKENKLEIFACEAAFLEKEEVIQLATKNPSQLWLMNNGRPTRTISPRPTIKVSDWDEVHSFCVRWDLSETLVEMGGSNNPCQLCVCDIHDKTNPGTQIKKQVKEMDPISVTQQNICDGQFRVGVVFHPHIPHNVGCTLKLILPMEDFTILAQPVGFVQAKDTKEISWAKVHAALQAFKPTPTTTNAEITKLMRKIGDVLSVTYAGPGPGDYLSSTEFYHTWFSRGPGALFYGPKK